MDKMAYGYRRACRGWFTYLQSFSELLIYKDEQSFYYGFGGDIKQDKKNWKAIGKTYHPKEAVFSHNVKSQLRTFE